VLTNGVNNFRASFQAKNTQPPPMKIFIKLYTDWCGPCKKIAPILDELSMYEQHRDVIFLMFNADLMIKGQDPYSKELVSMLKIGAVPAFFAVVDGRITGNVMGANVDEIVGLLNSLHAQRK
jgi:thioredoxin 1